MAIISYSLAQNIVDYMMQMVSNSINIIDKRGVIIASGDPERLGQLHKIALTAIKNNRVEIVNEDADGMKKGVNMPFYCRKEIAGVVGISGEIEETMRIIELTKCTIELLVEQETLLHNKQISQQLKSQFLFEWLFLSTDHDLDFIARGKSLNIDVTVPKRVAIVQFPDELKGKTLIEQYFDNENRDNYYIQSSPVSYTLILSNMDSQPWELKKILSSSPQILIGYGDPEKIVNHSLIQAQAALRLGPIIYPQKKVLYYSDVKHLQSMLNGIDVSNSNKNLTDRLGKLVINTNENLLKTLASFVHNNGEMNIIAQELHIHRNTLNYRIDKIHQITGLNPRNFKDLFMLFCAYVQYKQQMKE